MKYFVYICIVFLCVLVFFFDIQIVKIGKLLIDIFLELQQSNAVRLFGAFGEFR